jgi:hypothetical protein
MMSTHAKPDKQLTRIERRKVVSHTNTLEAAADILDKSCSLECIQA